MVVSARETSVQERALRPGRIYPADGSVAHSWDGRSLAIPPPAWHARLRRRVVGKQKAPRRAPGKTKVPAAMRPPGASPVPDISLDGADMAKDLLEFGNLDPGTASVWQVISTSRSDD